ncbi:MAG: hypothetical protein MZV64_29645 [Ignavibacteriales bacterium]|nr:hypothetical protein [Ignavibacteriales bacterium]
MAGVPSPRGTSGDRRDDCRAGTEDGGGNMSPILLDTAAIGSGRSLSASWRRERTGPASRSVSTSWRCWQTPRGLKWPIGSHRSVSG